MHLHNQSSYSLIMASQKSPHAQLHSKARLRLIPRAFVTDINEFEPRKLHASFVGPDYIRVVGGDGSSGILKDCCVWDESAAWECQDCKFTDNSTLAFPNGIAGHQIVKLNDKYVLTGGYDTSFYPLNTVYKSDDGKSWEKSLTGDDELFTPRHSHGSVVLDDKVILVMGGLDKTMKKLNDVWKSTDKGETWEQILPTTDKGDDSRWSPRSNFATATFPHNGKDVVVIIGGDIDENYPTKTDIWLSDDQGNSWTEITPTWKQYNENTRGLRAVYVPALSEPNENKYRIMVVGGYSNDSTDSFMRIGTFTYKRNNAGWTVEWNDCPKSKRPWGDESPDPRRWDHALSISNNDKVYVTAGDLGSQKNNELWKWQCHGKKPQECFQNVCDNWKQLYPVANDKLYLF